MADTAPLRCDGCGQISSPEHVATRLKRLELATHYRPIHVGVLFLGAVAPRSESESLYSHGEMLQGEAKAVLGVVGLSPERKPPEALLAEFQRGGFFLAHVLECPLERGENESAAVGLVVNERLPFALSRIRRSLKPKRLVLISHLLEPFIPRLEAGSSGCAVLLDAGKAFALDGAHPEQAIVRLHDALGAATAATR